MQGGLCRHQQPLALMPPAAPAPVAARPVIDEALYAECYDEAITQLVAEGTIETGEQRGRGADDGAMHARTHTAFQRRFDIHTPSLSLCLSVSRARTNIYPHHQQAWAASPT